MNQRTMLLDLGTGRTRPMRPSAPLCSSAPKNWTEVLVEEFEPAESCSTEVALMSNVIFMPVHDNVEVEWNSRGQTVNRRVAPGQISILPANHPYSVRVRAAGGSVVVSLSQKLVACSAAEQGVFDQVEPVWMHGVNDALMRELIFTLREEMWNKESNQAAYARSIASALAAHIIRRYSTSGRQLSGRTGGLSVHALRRVVMHIEDHLDTELSLSELADVAELSSCHFARMFKASTGVAPHQYVVNSRITRAKQLLTRPGMNLADVALRTGFCDQGHLTRCFKKLVGTTPAAFVKELATRSKVDEALQ